MTDQRRRPSGKLEASELTILSQTPFTRSITGMLAHAFPRMRMRARATTSFTKQSLLACAQPNQARRTTMQPDDDKDLQVNLNASISALAIALLGENNRKLSNRRQLRWGNNGSLAVAIQGPKIGSWHSKETGKGGGPLQLIMNVRGVSYDDAKVWAGGWLDMPGSGAKPAHPASALLGKHRVPSEPGNDDDEAARIRLARAVWEGSVPVEGTLAHHYLTVARGIPCPPRGWPDSIRFHTGLRTLVVAATNAADEITAIQQVRLDYKTGGKISDEEAARMHPPAVKPSYGVVKGAAVRLPGEVTGPLLLAEGPETGLSVWVATGMETWIALGLGSMASIPLPAGRRIIVCRDDDARFSPADNAIRGMIRNWRKAGLDISIATPWETRLFDKSDLNDVIKAGGVNAVRDAIDRTAHPKPVQVDRKTKEATSSMMSVAFSKFFAIASGTNSKTLLNPPAASARVDTGTGKSAMARLVAWKALATMRGKLNDNRTFAVAVSTIELAEDAVASFHDMQSDFVAAIWRGREQPDPGNSGNAMCLNLDAVRDAHKAGVSVQSGVCFKPAPKNVLNAVPHKCPFYDRCGYQRQREQKADVWYMAHQLIFQKKQAAFGDVAGLIVDESCWQAGLEGVDKPITLALDALVVNDTVYDDDFATERLRFLRHRVLDVLNSEPDGPLRREALLAVGMTPEAANEARGYESRRLSETAIVPGMSSQERAPILHRFGEHNRTIKRLMLFWTAVEALLRGTEDDPLAAQYRADVSRKPVQNATPAELSGWASLAHEGSKAGPVRILMLKGRKPIGEGWGVPTLLMDADLHTGMMQRFWPYFVQMLDCRTETPHQYVIQVVGRHGYGKTWLQDEKHLRETAAVVNRFMHGATTALLVTNKEIKDRLPKIWLKPEHVDTAHFNSVAGIDKWNRVSKMGVVGSANPPPAEVEKLAEALTGEHIPPIGGPYPRRIVMRELENGSYVAAESDYHPNETAEAIRYQIRTGGNGQAVGRGRGVQRTADNPVSIMVMDDSVLPFPVRLVDAADLAASPWDLMMAAGGVAFGNPEDASLVYPELWEKPETARKAFQRAEAEPTGTNPAKYKDGLLSGECPTWHYRKVGDRQKTREVVIDPARVPDPAAWLAERLGPLARCKAVA